MQIAETVTANFTTWGDAVRAGNPLEVAALYTDNFVLLPTMAPDIIHTKEGCEKYFTFFCGLKPSASIVEEFIEPISEESYFHGGVYRFNLDTDQGRQDVDARFSMLWKKEGNTWKIVHHHSSRIPVL